MADEEKKVDFDKQAHQADVLDLMRKVCGGIQVSDIVNLDDLEGQSKAEFLRYCSEVASSPWFDLVFKSLFFPQIMAAATKAENYDIVTFHRATANGISLAREFFQKQNRRFHEEYEKDNSGFDTGKPFETTESPDIFPHK